MLTSSQSNLPTTSPRDSETFLSPASCKHKNFTEDSKTVAQNADRERMVCAIGIDVHTSLDPGHMTNIHHEYRTTLAFWKRKLFDPFRRRTRCTVTVDGMAYETTLGQANFAIWAYRTGVLAYVLGHVDEIEADMNAVSQRQKRERREAASRGVRRKRTELTSGPSSMCVAYVSPMRVVFDTK